MPTTTRQSLPTMADSDPLSDVAQAIRDLGDALDELLPIRGVATVTLTAASQAFTTVTFPMGSFATAPIVTATVDGNALYYADVANRTSTTVRIYAVHRDGTSATTTVDVCWTAVKA